MPRMLPTTLDTCSPALAQLSADERAALCALMRTRAYESGEIIFREGEPSDALWFVEQGRVRLFKTAPNGRELTVCIVHPGNRLCLGTCPLFDSDVNPVSAQALGAAILKLIPKQRVQAHLRANPRLGMAFGKMMADRFRHFARLTAALALHCVRVRVADALLELAHSRGIRSERGIEIDLDLTQELLASCLGTDRAVIARTLLAFERQGLLEARGKHITLLDVAPLERLAHRQCSEPVANLN